MKKLKEEVKGLQGRLREKAINRLQKFYGIPLCSNPGNFKEMWDNVMTVMGQVASIEENSWHDKCPKGSELVQIPI